MYLFILITSIIVFTIYKEFRRWKKKLPEGVFELPSAPGGWHIVGHLFSLGSRPCEYFTNISRKIGPIYKIQIGWKEIVVLNNYEIISKCLKDDGLNFSGRWRNTFSDQLARYCGLALQENEWWSTQRSFAIQSLKDFGFGKSQTEAIIQREVEKVIKIIKATHLHPISSAKVVTLPSFNVISDFILKTEFTDKDSESVSLMGDIRKATQNAELNAVFVNLFPLFKNFPNIENKIYILLDSSKVVDIVERLYSFIQKYVDEHKETFDPSNECRDLIDAFLLQQHKLKKLNATNHSFVDFQLIRLISELFAAGIETTTTSLTWAMLLLSRFKNIQRKMHEEIVSNIGIDRLPTMADKKSLPYSQAVMDEILRFVSLFPLSIPHRVFNDTSINGYFIPGDSVIFPNLYACHRDPVVWERPNDFYPEHFLDLEGKYKPRPELIPFGIGKRSCLGESLAKMEYFIFLATIIQRFKLSLDDVSDKMDDSLLFQGTGGLVSGPIEHEIIFEEIL